VLASTQPLLDPSITTLLLQLLKLCHKTWLGELCSSSSSNKCSNEAAAAAAAAAAAINAAMKRQQQQQQQHAADLASLMLIGVGCSSADDAEQTG
jgi:hypothetical protein